MPACFHTLTLKVVDTLNFPIAYVGVFIAETGTGAYTDTSGIVVFHKLCSQDYTLSISCMGCEARNFQSSLRQDTFLQVVLRESSILLEGTTVTGELDRLGKGTLKQVLEGVALRSRMAFGLAESLAQMPGVQTLNTGASISKPILQGLHSNRVLILQNGVRQEGQQWGMEHAPEIDPFLSTRLQVIRGAGNLRFGGDALGGIILVEPLPLLSTKGMDGELHLQGLSNAQVGISSGRVDAALPLAGTLLSGRIQGTLRSGGNWRTPDYFAQNTGSRERNFSWMLGASVRKWHPSLFYSRYFSVLGILRDAHIGNLTDLRLAVDRGRPLQDGQFTRLIGRPQQQVLHEFFQFRNKIYLPGEGLMEVNLSRQFNRRREFDAHRNFKSLPETLDKSNMQFEITTHRGDLDLEHNWDDDWHGHAGFAFMRQVNTTDRGGLIPDFTQWSSGVYYTLKFAKPFAVWTWEGGVRYDRNALRLDRPSPPQLAYQAISAAGWSHTLSATYHFSQDGFLLFQTGTAWRMPHVSELFSQGVHHGSASFEKGNPNLAPERAFNNSVQANLATERWQLQTTLYYNRIRDFIFLSPQPEAVLTIRGAFPAFHYTHAHAGIAGFDGLFAFRPDKRWQVTFQPSLLWARNISAGDYLVFMPPRRFTFHLSWYYRAQEESRQDFLRIQLIRVDRQNRTPNQYDYASPPEGYWRLDLEWLAHLPLTRQKPIEVGIALLNVTNTRYRDYLNRFRYFIQEPGRNLSLRVQIPLSSNPIE